MTSIPPEAVEAALAVLREDWTDPWRADSSAFLGRTADGGYWPTPGTPEREAALAALRAADDEAERLTADSIRRALAAAAPHLQRQTAAEIALKIASVAADMAVRTGWTYTETHRQLMAASGYVPSPSVQRSNSND